MKILLPVDGSKASLQAAKYAAMWAKNFRSKVTITLLSVHESITFNHAKKVLSKESIDDYLREMSEKDLKGAQKVLDAAGVKHSMVIEQGHPAEVIIKLANKEKMDLIVMGAKGRNGFLDVLLGSVAQRVSSSAKQPVLLVK
ncbi:MAG: universal stress protein [Cytophagales bacterium]|nr:universal stress protein [Cytophagales bacterium]